MTMKSPHTDRIESGRKILNAPTSTIVELEASETLVRHVLVETDVELKEMAQRRKAILASDAPSGDLDKQVERHDETVRALTRRNEIAAALATKLATRIAADREVERAAKQQAALDEALEVHKAATRIVKEGLREMGETVRRILRVYDESEMLTAAVNQDLPPGAAPIPSIEVERKGKVQPSKVTTRHFKAFVHNRRRVAEQGYVQAAEEKDGRWSVFIPGGSTSGGDYLTCDLVDFVEVTTETDATPWPEGLANTLSVPAFFVTEASGWDALENRPVYPGDITRALNRLESREPQHLQPRVSERVMTLAAWCEMHGEVAEAEPAPALAAE
jgi:hypothetical protein